MTADLSISPEEDAQLSFDQISDHHQMIALPNNMIGIFSERVSTGQPILVAAGQQTADHQLKYLAVQYASAGTFTRLVSATLKPLTQAVCR